MPLLNSLPFGCVGPHHIGPGSWTVTYCSLDVCAMQTSGFFIGAYFLAVGGVHDVCSLATNALKSAAVAGLGCCIIF